MELLLFVLASYGLTQILVYGKIFSRIRPETGRLGELFRCPMCMGFWVGLFLYFLSFWTELFTFDLGYSTPYILGWISSGTSYILCQVFDDEGIKVKRTQ